MSESSPRGRTWSKNFRPWRKSSNYAALCGASFDLHFDAFNEHHLAAPRRVPFEAFALAAFPENENTSAEEQEETEIWFHFWLGCQQNSRKGATEKAEPEQKDSSNKMILMILKYMPHNIQPDKILNISASIIACCLSARPSPFSVLSRSLLYLEQRKSIKSRAKFAWNYFFPLAGSFFFGCVMQSARVKRAVQPSTTSSRWSRNKNRITNNLVILESHSTEIRNQFEGCQHGAII